MRKLKFVVGVVTLLLLLQFTLVLQVSGITQATRDYENRYNSVGVLKVVHPDGTEVFRCSGTLISPTKFLMLGWCMNYSLIDPNRKGYISLDNNIYDEEDEPWFEIKETDFVRHYMTINSGNGVGGLHSLVVVTLPEDFTAGHTWAKLTPPGLLDIRSAQGGLRGVEFTSVGYGYQADWERGPVYGWIDGWRNYASAPFQLLTREFLDLNINEHATGGGGACWGDIGGPLFLPVNGQDILVGVATWRGTEPTCRATAGYFRLDTPWAQEFLSNYVGEGR